MRNLGAILLLAGVLGFFYASGRVSDSGGVPQGDAASAVIENTAARWDLVRYGCAGAAVIGLVLLLFPKGR